MPKSLPQRNDPQGPNTSVEARRAAIKAASERVRNGSIAFRRAVDVVPTPRVCADCGLELAHDQPSPWNGHVHKPVSREVMEAGASVMAMANIHGLPMPLQCRELGFTAEGVKTYLTVQRERKSA